MTLADKRKVIEVLLCGSDVNSPSVSFLALEIGLDFATSSISTDLRCAASRANEDLSYEESCVLAAYRLIETSPTLRREWFGGR